ALAIESAVKGLAAWVGHGFWPEDAAGLMHGLDLAAWAGRLDHVQAGMEAVAMMAGIIVVNARAGTRPRWSRELPEPFPDRGGNGKRKVLIEETFVQKYDGGGMYHEPTRDDPEPGAIPSTKSVPSPPIRAGVYRPGAYCPLVYRPSPAGVVRERAEYAAWRMGLEILAGQLGGEPGAIGGLAGGTPWRARGGEGGGGRRGARAVRGAAR